MKRDEKPAELADHLLQYQHTTVNAEKVTNHVHPNLYKLTQIIVLVLDHDNENSINLHLFMEEVLLEFTYHILGGAFDILNNLIKTNMQNIKQLLGKYHNLSAFEIGLTIQFILSQPPTFAANYRFYVLYIL